MGWRGKGGTIWTSSLHNIYENPCYFKHPWTNADPQRHQVDMICMEVKDGENIWGWCGGRSNTTPLPTLKNHHPTYSIDKQFHCLNYPELHVYHTIYFLKVLSYLTRAADKMTLYQITSNSFHIAFFFPKKAKADAELFLFLRIKELLVHSELIFGQKAQNQSSRPSEG